LLTPSDQFSDKFDAKWSKASLRPRLSRTAFGAPAGSVIPTDQDGGPIGAPKQCLSVKWVRGLWCRTSRATDLLRRRTTGFRRGFAPVHSGGNGRSRRDLPVGARPGPRKASRSVAVVAKSTAATGAVVAPSRAESRLAALASAGVVTSVMGSPPDHRIGGRQGKPCGSGTVGRSARSRLPG